MHKNPIDNLISILQELQLFYKEIEVGRGDFLKVGSSIDTDGYIVTEGCFRIFVMDNDEEQTIRFGYENEFITALDSYLSGAKSDFYIQAMKKSKVKAVRKHDLSALIDSDIQYIKAWNSILENFVLQQMERERDLLTVSPKQRYLRVLSRSPQLFQKVPHKYIASYLRMTPETLSRISNKKK